MVLAIAMRYENTESNNRKIFVKKYYYDIFEKLGVVLFPVISAEMIEEVVSLCDGLILPGGAMNIHPNYYHEEWMRDPKEAEEYMDYNDTLDFALIKAFSEAKKPILGICRGIQSLNVYFGGSLNQKVIGHHATGKKVEHIVNLEKESFLYECYQKPKVLVNSYHNLAVKEVASGFKVTAIGEDGIIEGIEKENIIGVQWHPEMIYDLQFFHKFLQKFFK